MKNKIIFVILLKLSFLHAQDFYISEVLTAKNPKKHWLELANISNKIIFINQISINIISDKKKLLLEYKFDSPVLFEDRLLIANQNNLGFSECINKNINIISLDNFNLSKSKKLNICIQINQQENLCFNLPNNFVDQAGLYKSSPDSFWSSEPCMLKPGVYATPGLAEKACILEPDFAELIFAGCDSPKAYYSNTLRLNALTAHKPEIINKYLENNKLYFTLIDKDPSDWWRLLFCAAKNNKILCEEQTEPTLINNHNNIINLDNLKNLQEYDFEIRDLYNLTEKHKLVLNQDSNIIIEKLDFDKYEIHVKLHRHNLPINITVKNLLGQILAQQAFIESGLHRIKFRTQEKNIIINWSNKLEVFITSHILI